MWSELFHLALGNLGRSRARLAMTAAGVVVGTTAVILLIAVALGLQEAAEAGIGSDISLTEIDVSQRWNESAAPAPTLNDEAIIALRRIEGVRLVIPTLRLQSGRILADNYEAYADIRGIDAALIPYLGWEAASGSLSLDEGMVIVGSRVGEGFYDPDNIEDYVPVTVDVMSASLELNLSSYTSGSNRELDLVPSAQLAETGTVSDYMIFMSLDEVKRWNEWITGQEYTPETLVYDQVTVYATSRETAPVVSDAIRELGFTASGMGDYLNQLNAFFVTMRVCLGAIGGVALLVAAFGVANTMMMAILERTHEIGIMKAIGADNESILGLFLLEAGLVGFVGGLVGVLLSKLLQNLINSALENLPSGEGVINFLPFNASQLGANLIIIPQELIIFALLLATVVGILAGIYPAWRAAKMPPVLALKFD
jgi:putative ABC transport system permease protein